MISRSRTLATSTTVGFASSDRRVLDITVAATIDAGAGDDTVHASDLGDNIFRGWVHGSNHHRLLEPIGNIPLTEAEANHYAAMSNLAMAA